MSDQRDGKRTRGGGALRIYEGLRHDILTYLGTRRTADVKLGAQEL